MAYQQWIGVRGCVLSTQWTCREGLWSINTGFAGRGVSYQHSIICREGCVLSTVLFAGRGCVLQQFYLQGGVSYQHSVIGRGVGVCPMVYYQPHVLPVTKSWVGAWEYQSNTVHITLILRNVK